LVIECLRLDIEERDIPLEALYLADEAFLTSSIRDVQPVRSVDGRGLASCPGRLTEIAAGAYAALLAGDPDP
jgi:branched-chain amino acid aminotransferase